MFRMNRRQEEEPDGCGVLHTHRNGRTGHGEGNNDGKAEPQVAEAVEEKPPVPVNFLRPEERKQHTSRNEGPQGTDQERIQSQILHKRRIETPADSACQDKERTGNMGNFHSNTFFLPAEST